MHYFHFPAYSIRLPDIRVRLALFALLNGNIYESILINPYGLLLLLLATSYIIGMASDLIRKRQQFRNWLKQTEQYLANKYILTILIALTILNWIWNINKGL